METWSDASSVLEDTKVRLVPDHEPAAFYCWPVWRFGRVLQPHGGKVLEVEAAQEIGTLFEPGQPAARRYLTDRIAALQELASRSGGSLLTDWPRHLRYTTKAFRELKSTWLPEEILTTYSYVPIIRLPRFLVQIGQSTWLVRESLTICGFPAKSKTWVTASLLTYEGQPTDAVSLSKVDLDAGRQAFDAFVRGSLASLSDYYLKVLNEDTRSLSGMKPLRIRKLEPLAETEIVSLASNVDLRNALEALEEKGFRRFQSEASKGKFSGAREVLDFLQWVDQVEMPDGGEWRPGRPKILAIYAEEPACGSVRALVIPKIDSTQNRTWYAALTELKQAEKQPTSFPLSESAGRFLAREYGRYF